MAGSLWSNIVCWMLGMRVTSVTKRKINAISTKISQLVQLIIISLYSKQLYSLSLLYKVNK